MRWTFSAVGLLMLLAGQVGSCAQSQDSALSQELDELDRHIDDFVSKRASGIKVSIDDELTYLRTQGIRARPGLEKAYQRNKPDRRKTAELLNLYDGLIGETRVVAGDVEFLWRSLNDTSALAEFGPLIGMIRQWRLPPRNRKDVRLVIDLLDTKDPYEGTHFATMGMVILIVRDWFDFLPKTTDGAGGLSYRKELKREYGRWFDKVSDYTHREYTATELPDGRIRYLSRVKVNSEAQKANKPVDFLTGKMQ